MEPTLWPNDPALASLLALVRADADSEGLLLGGSRGAAADDHESDYDLEWVLSDRAFDEHQARGEPRHVRHHPLDPRFDVSFSCPRELAALATRGSWELPARRARISAPPRPCHHAGGARPRRGPGLV